MSRYFAPSEFTRCTPPCSESDLDPDFVRRLDALRDMAGIPIVLNSAYRSPDYERQKGRKGTSSHCFGHAVDVRCASSVERYKIVSCAVTVGFRRIGIGSMFIHLDDMPGYPSPCIWLY